MSESGRQTVLLVEDDEPLRKLLAWELSDLRLKVTAVATAEQALWALQEYRPTLVVSDLRLPDMDGIRLLAKVNEQKVPRPPPIVVITAFATIDRAVQALKEGAAEFLTKPLDLEHFRLRIERLLEVELLRQSVRRHRQGAEAESFHGIIGQSRPMQRVFDSVQQVARARGPVLIVGESGVGKELVARAIHREGERRDGPFVPVNCASVPENLLESEFFGHESGAFTGAVKAREGLLAAADGGTVLLDEVGELPTSLQVKLLRVLQEGRVRRVGATHEVPLNIRVLAATNRDLEEDMAVGRFRKDLYFRLATFVIDVPPLAERGGDIELLAAHFLSCHTGTRGAPSLEGFSESVLERLRSYDFPGNVRELENIVEHAATFCRGSLIELADLPPRVHTDRERSPRSGLPAALLNNGSLLTLDELATRYVRHVLEATQDNKRRAAKLLGISRQTLYRYLARR